jgi:hypothetical protein
MTCSWPWSGHLPVPPSILLPHLHRTPLEIAINFLLRPEQRGLNGRLSSPSLPVELSDEGEPNRLPPPLLLIHQVQRKAGQLRQLVGCEKFGCMSQKRKQLEQNLLLSAWDIFLHAWIHLTGHCVLLLYIRFRPRQTGQLEQPMRILSNQARRGTT